MKHVVATLFLLSPFLLNALSQQVEIKADSFEADEIKKVSYFRGHVSIKKGNDFIKSNELKIDFDKNNKPISYYASGDVNFKLNTNNQHFVGSSQTITYQPFLKVYTAKGKVNIVETNKNRVLVGDKIIINRLNGTSTITGTKNKPVKFTFTVQE